VESPSVIGEEEERVRARRKAAKKVQATPALPPPPAAVPSATPTATAVAAPVSVWLRLRRKSAVAASPRGAATANSAPNHPSADPSAAKAKSGPGDRCNAKASAVEPGRKRKRPLDPAVAAARAQKKAKEKHRQASDAVKDAIKPFWKSNKITKDQYKAVCKEAVRDIMKHSRPWPPELAGTLVKECVGRCRDGMKGSTDTAAAAPTSDPHPM